MSSPSTDDRPPRDVPRVGATGVVAFLCELALLALVAVVGWRLGGASGPGGVALSLVLAVALPALVVVVWGRWFAPTATRRLPQPWRLDGQIALFVGAGLAAAGVGLVWWGVGLALVGTTAFALTRDR
jgi:Kef-type K+ transport system membrane component KefB